MARARIPLRYSQGFNPHPVMSLAAPRPVGVASADDLLAVSLDQPEGEPDRVDAAELLGRLNAQAPRGMRFLAAERFEGKSPQPCRVSYRTPLEGRRIEQVGRRLDELAGMESWPLERLTTAKRGSERGRFAPRTIDVRPLVADLRISEGSLCMSLVGRCDMWARPGEVLRLLGLDERADLARTVRTCIDCKQEP